MRRGDTEHVMHGSRIVLVGLVLMLLSACGAQTGDCNARIRYEGVVYRPHNALDQSLPQGAELGAGDVVDCGNGADAPKVDDVTVYAVKGVSTSIAVGTGAGDWSGIYVAENLPPADWPASLRKP
jgi:hypothetical protein